MHPFDAVGLGSALPFSSSSPASQVVRECISVFAPVVGLLWARSVRAGCQTGADRTELVHSGLPSVGFGVASMTGHKSLAMLKRGE